MAGEEANRYYCGRMSVGHQQQQKKRPGEAVDGGGLSSKQRRMVSQSVCLFVSCVFSRLTNRK